MEKWVSVPEGRTAQLANWRQAPHNKWAFHNVGKILTTDDIDRRADGHTPLGTAAPRSFDQLVFKAPDGEMTVERCLAQSDTDSFLVLKDNEILYAVFGTNTIGTRRQAYFRQLALTPAAGKEVRVFGLSGWLVDRFYEQWLGTMREAWAHRRRGQPALLVSLVVLGASNIVAGAVVVDAATSGEIGLAHSWFCSRRS